MNRDTKEIEPYLASFEKFERNGFSSEPAWLRSIRQGGISHFGDLGFPTIRHEEWKYTNITPITKLPFRPVFQRPAGSLTQQQTEQFTLGHLKSSRLVFVDGHYSEALSSILPQPRGVIMGSLASAIKAHPGLVQQYLTRYAPASEHTFVALNTAFFQDGAFIHVPEQIVIEDPVRLLFIACPSEAGAAIHPRNLVIMEKGGKAIVSEHYLGMTDSAYLTNAVTEIMLGENASIEYGKVQSESLEAFHIANIQFHLNQNSNLLNHSFSWGARLARNDIRAVLNGEGINCTLNGLYMAEERQLIDHHTVIDHAKPHCNSHQFYNGILNGHSRGVFNGKIFVRPNAQKTDAKQTNRNLLLSDTATINTKPQLEIFADDVKCTHGATVGQLDEEAIFYLQSRGIGREVARRMLVYAFAGDIINRISLEPYREQLDAILVKRLEGHTRIVESL